MTSETDLIIKKIREYIQELEKMNIPVTRAVLFGSYARGNPKEESDIDIAVVSPAFVGDRFEDRRKIVPLRRKIDGKYPMKVIFVIPIVNSNFI